LKIENADDNVSSAGHQEFCHYFFFMFGEQSNWPSSQINRLHIFEEKYVSKHVCWMLHKSLVLVTSRKLINDIGIHSFSSCHILFWVVGGGGICIVMLSLLTPPPHNSWTYNPSKFLHCSFKQATIFSSW